MEEKENEFVAPGDEIGTSEEWLPGEGTHEEEGVLYASVFGKVHYDDENLEAEVKPNNPISDIKEDEIVYGNVRRNQGSIASLDLELIEGLSRGIERDIEGSLHVSKISDDYIENISEVLKKRDIVRAKVTQTEPSIQLTTQEDSLGVVRGNCTNCRRPMEKKGSRLYCENCDRTEKRKVSKVYGKIKMKEKE